MSNLSMKGTGTHRRPVVLPDPSGARRRAK